MKMIIYFLSILILNCAQTFAGDFDISKLPKLLGSNNMGREFYLTFTPVIGYGEGDSGFMIYITSNVRTKVVVSIDQKGYQEIKYTTQNEILAFKLSGIAVPYRFWEMNKPQPDQVWRGAGVHVVADDPVICYAMTREKYTADGYIAIPINKLGIDYIVSSWADPADNVNQWLPSFTGVVAAYDKTKIYFTMGGTDSSKTASGLKPGETSKWNLNEGDVFLASSLGKHAELTGSIVRATKPVAVVSGNFCANIPTECGICEYITEMELPTYSWGTAYHVTPIIAREKNSMIKIFAKDSNTTIYRNDNSIGFIKYPGGEENLAWITIRADAGLPKPVVISGDKPINVTQYNTGQQDDNVQSDPFQMVLVPTDHYQKEITFNTPGTRGGLSFPKNFVNLCYESDSSGNLTDDIEIGFYNPKDTAYKWFKLKDTLGSQGKPFYNSGNEKQYSYTTIELPEDAVYKLRAEKPFQAYMYGFSSWDSYGMPASVSLKNLSKNDTLPPEIEFTVPCSGNINVDTIRYVNDRPDDIAYRTNLSEIYMHSDLSYNYKLYVSDFMPCEEQTAAWRLEIIDNSEDALAVISFTDCNGKSLDTFVMFTADKVKLIDKTWDFGRHNVGDNSTRMFHLVNYSETDIYYLEWIMLKKKNAGFSIFEEDGITTLNLSGDNPRIIPPLDTFHFIVKFEAFKEGEFWDSIGFGNVCGFWFKSYVEANVGTPIIQVSDWNFPPTRVEGLAFGVFTVKNIGTVQLDISGYTGPFTIGNISKNQIYNSDELASRNISDVNLLSLKVNESIAFVLTFTPDDTLTFPDSIVFISNSISGADNVCLIDGRGLISDLQANGYNWGRKRINRPGTFDMPEYPGLETPTQQRAIVLKNDQNTDIQIINVKEIQRQGDISAFKFDMQALTGTLKARDSIYVPVSFLPASTGLHLLTFEYLTNNPLIKGVTSTLQGVGIVPRIETENVDFGVTILNDFANYITRSFKFRNLANTEWQFGDSVTITDFKDLGVNPEDVDITDWSTFKESFRYGKQNITFPILLQPGEEFKTDFAYFTARDSNGNPETASITSVSDAEFEVTSNWTGDGTLQSARVSGDQTTLCVGNSEDLEVLIENTNETDILVKSIKIQTDDSNKFEIVDDKYKSGFWLRKNSSVSVRIRYSSNVSGSHTAFVVIRTNALTQDSVITALLNGESVLYTSTIKVVPKENIIPVPLNDFVERKIVLDSGASFDLARIVGIILNIKFNGELLKVATDPDNSLDIDKNGIILGSLFNNYPAGSFKYNVLKSDSGEITIEIQRQPGFEGIYFNSPEGGELLSITMKTNTLTSSPRLSNFDVIVDFEEELGGKCVDVFVASGTILVDTIRNSILSSVIPNPVIGDEAKIEFDIDKKDSRVKIEVYNLLGQLIEIPLNTVLQPGRYSIPFSVKGLGSGSYYIFMKTGTFEGQLIMIISK